MDVEKQVLVIWAATEGYTDDVSVDDIRSFEAELLSFMENSHPSLLVSIREQKSLTDEIRNDLHQALKDFKELWREKKAQAAPGAPSLIPSTPVETATAGL